MSEAGHGGSPVTDSARDLAREVLVHGPISRTELSRRLGLSPASLTRLSRTFLDSGILVEGPEVSDGAVGRPVKPLDVRVDARRFVGIKLTGEAALGVSTDLRAAQTGSASSDLASTTLDGVLDAIERVVDTLGGPAGFDGIGVSLGGNVSDGVVDRAPFLGWRDVDLRSALVDRLGIPTTVENDVVALTAAEHWFGAGRGSTDFAVLTIGAGVGYGLVVNDHVVRTADVGFGLLGHFPLDATGPLCMDGHRGCSTAMLTTGSMRAQTSVALGRQVTYEEVLLLAAQDHPVAREVVGSAVRSLGRLIAAITNIALVSTVVLAGEGVSLVDGRETELDAAIAADRDPDGGPVRLVVDDSGFVPWARGAAAVAIQSSFGVLGT
jgi:predicted NBD/HSP70 family sugar kinase